MAKKQSKKADAIQPRGTEETIRKALNVRRPKGGLALGQQKQSQVPKTVVRSLTAPRTAPSVVTFGTQK
jgi:hypothetical protein